MKITRKIVGAFSLLLVISCGGDSHTKSSRTPIERVTGAHYANGSFSLCEGLAIFDGGAGYYEVVSLESAMEPLGKRDIPFTYVSLRLIEAWSDGAPANPVVRMGGGVYPDGSELSSEASFARGEKVGVLLAKPTEVNRGYFATIERGVFRQTGEVFTNGLHDLGRDRHEAARAIGLTLGQPADECAKNDVPARVSKGPSAVSPPGDSSPIEVFPLPPDAGQ